MSRVGKEASGIGQHSDKTGQIAEVCEGDHLILHTGLVIVEPPRGSLLNFRNGGGILETSENRSDRLIVVRIQAVNDRFRKLVRLNQRIQIIGHFR